MLYLQIQAIWELRLWKEFQRNAKNFKNHLKTCFILIIGQNMAFLVGFCLNPWHGMDGTPWFHQIFQKWSLKGVNMSYIQQILPVCIFLDSKDSTHNRYIVNREIPCSNMGATYLSTWQTHEAGWHQVAYENHSSVMVYCNTNHNTPGLACYLF